MESVAHVEPERSAETWPTPATVSVRARELGLALGVTRTFAELLDRRGHRDLEATRRFLNPRLAELTSPDAMADRGLAADRLASAIRRGERIAVFGDYDCDGMTSAAIMTEVLRALGAEVVPFVASRFDGGYGLSHAATDKILASGAKLLVTCDCGSSDHVSLARTRAAGVDAIVIDHHLVPDEPLPVLAFLNPHRVECGFPYKGLASCGLALSIAAALRSALGKELDLRRWLDLVAIGTIADVAPLDGDNRALVRAGLRSLATGARPGIRALCELARIELGTPLCAEDIAYRIAPRLNAPGRLGSPDIAVKLLLCQSAGEAQALAAEIEQRSSERRALQDRMIAEALEDIERENWAERPAIVVGREGWNHGIVGIVAGRLAARFERPVIVFGFTAGVGRGSVRGPEGARLYDALSAAKDIVVRFGGHQAAAGVEIEWTKLGELRECFEASCASIAALSEIRAPSEAALAWLAAGDEFGHVFKDLCLLEPCGAGNPAPDVAFEAQVLSAREVQGGHLKLELEVAGGARIGAFGVAMGEKAHGLTGRVVVSGKLRRDRYRGGDALELKLERIFS